MRSANMGCMGKWVLWPERDSGFAVERIVLFGGHFFELWGRHPPLVYGQSSTAWTGYFTDRGGVGCS